MSTRSAARIDLHLNGDQVSIADMVRFAVAAEDAGLGGVWVGEVYRDAFVPLTAIAGATESIVVGSSVAQWTRSLPNLELAAADLDEVAEGRFVLGLGSSTKEWNEQWHGIAYDRPLTRMREYVEALRLLWTATPTAPVTYTGEVFTVQDYVRFNGPLSRSVPIALAASRPMMTRLAGEIADVVHFNSCLSPDYIAQVLLPELERGCDDAGRPERPIVGSLTITAVHDDADTARRWARHQLAFYAGVADYFREPWRFHGFGAAHERVRELFHTGDVQAAIDAVPEGAVKAMTLAGSPDQVRAGCERFGGVVDHAMLTSPSFLMTADEIATNHQNIIAAFATG